VHRQIQLLQTNSWAEKLLSRVNRPFANFNEITPDMFQNFEDHPEVVAVCERLSQGLKEAIANQRR